MRTVVVGIDRIAAGVAWRHRQVDRADPIGQGGGDFREAPAAAGVRTDPGIAAQSGDVGRIGGGTRVDDKLIASRTQSECGTRNAAHAGRGNVVLDVDHRACGNASQGSRPSESARALSLGVVGVFGIGHINQRTGQNVDQGEQGHLVFGRGRVHAVGHGDEVAGLEDRLECDGGKARGRSIGKGVARCIFDGTIDHADPIGLAVHQSRVGGDAHYVAADRRIKGHHGTHGVVEAQFEGRVDVGIGYGDTACQNDGFVEGDGGYEVDRLIGGRVDRAKHRYGGNHIQTAGDGVDGKVVEAVVADRSATALGERHFQSEIRIVVGSSDARKIKFDQSGVAVVRGDGVEGYIGAAIERIRPILYTGSRT